MSTEEPSTTVASTPDTEGGTPSTAIIDKRGDLLMTVGEGSKSRSLQVSSRVLSLASTVFEAMFNHGFAEGEGLSSATAPKEIAFPDDDPTSMTILCRVVHLRSDDVDIGIDIDLLAEFAILCDKYDCAAAVRPWSRLCIKELLQQPKDVCLEKVLFVCGGLDLPHEWYHATRAIVRDRLDCTHTHFAVRGHDFVPPKAIELLYKAQLNLQKEAMKALQPQHMTDMMKGAKNCNNCKNTFLKYMQQLTDYGLFPITNHSLLEYKARVSTFNRKEFSAEGECGARFGCCCSEFMKTINLSKNVYKDINQLYTNAQGYCLDCIIAEATGTPKASCRVSHI